MLIGDNGFKFTARALAVETRIYECINTSLNNKNSIIDSIKLNFEILKKRGFSFVPETFDENNNFRGDNYGNYRLSDIKLSDFSKIKEKSINENITQYLEALFGKDDLNREQLNYVNVINSALLFFVTDSTFAYELNVKELDKSDKRHKHYSLWEHFKSYIIFCNNNRRENFVYIEIGFD
jgi:hypothetical protein